MLTITAWLITPAELYALLEEVFNELVRNDSDSHERRNALASLENIEREFAFKNSIV